MIIDPRRTPRLSTFGGEPCTAWPLCPGKSVNQRTMGLINQVVCLSISFDGLVVPHKVQGRMAREDDLDLLFPVFPGIRDLDLGNQKELGKFLIALGQAGVSGQDLPADVVSIAAYDGGFCLVPGVPGIPGFGFNPWYTYTIPKAVGGQVLGNLQWLLASMVYQCFQKKQPFTDLPRVSDSWAVAGGLVCSTVGEGHVWAKTVHDFVMATLGVMAKGSLVPKVDPSQWVQVGTALVAGEALEFVGHRRVRELELVFSTRVKSQARYVWWGLNGLKVAIISIIAGVVLLIPGGMLVKALTPPMTKGMEPMEVVLSFYEAIAELDDAFVRSALLPGVEPELLDRIETLSVMTRVQQAGLGNALGTLPQGDAGNSGEGISWGPRGLLTGEPRWTGPDKVVIETSYTWYGDGEPMPRRERVHLEKLRGFWRIVDIE